MKYINDVGKVVITTLEGAGMTQIKTRAGTWAYHEGEDDFRSGDVVFKDSEGDWHQLECPNCGIQPMEGDKWYICPECNAIFR